MAIIVLIILALIIALAFLPQIWVQRVIQRHASERPDIPGTGGEFARHLLDRMGLRHVKVELSALGDHYDPETKSVRLLPAHMHRRSLSAIVIAAHEVGHAMQDATGYGPLIQRTRLALHAHRYQTVGVIVMLSAPLAFLIVKSPAVVALQVLVGFALMSMTIVMHALSLPVEFDASFRRAMPVLVEGRFIAEADQPAAREILRAAAFTYVAAAALSLLDILRWFRILRF